MSGKNRFGRAMIRRGPRGNALIGKRSIGKTLMGMALGSALGILAGALGISGAQGIAGPGVDVVMAAQHFHSPSPIVSGTIWVDGRRFQAASVIRSNGRFWLGLASLQQFLLSDGITSRWDGKRIVIDNLPAVDETAGVTLNGQLLPSGVAMVDMGTPELDMNVVTPLLGGALHYNNSLHQLELTLPSGSASQSGQVQSTAAPAARLLSRVTATRLHLRTIIQPVRNQVELVAGSTVFGAVSVMQVRSLTFVDAAAIQRFFGEYGITSKWSGNRWLVSSMPKCVPNASIVVGNKLSRANIIQYNGDWYVPATALASTSISAKYDAKRRVEAVTVPDSSIVMTISGQIASTAGVIVPKARVAVEDAAGNVSVLEADSHGHFTGTLHSLTGNVIGVATDADNWSTMAVPIAPLNHQAVNVLPIQKMTTVQGQLQFSGQSYKVTEVSVRNLITHEHTYAEVADNGRFTLNLPDGAYEVFALLTGKEPVYLMTPFVVDANHATLNVHLDPLPKQQIVGQTPDGQKVTVQAGDASVAPQTLLSVYNIYLHEYHADVADIGISPTSLITISVYSSIDSYRQHFLNEGYSQQDADNIAQNSAAVSEGMNSISVSGPAFNQADGLNIVAHEFAHCLIAEWSKQIPDWANEGIAWHEGVQGELDGSPSSLLASSMEWTQWNDIVAHQQAGDLALLGDAPSLGGNYNVEAEDYYAVENDLLKPNGLPAFLDYVKAIDKNPDGAFQAIYGETFSQFQQQVSAKLTAQVNQVDTGFIVKLKTLPGGPSSIYVQNPQGNNIQVNGLAPGTEYTLTCHADGTLDIPQGLASQSASSFAEPTTTDWTVGGESAASTFSRQEFDVADTFGEPFLVDAVLYDNAGQIAHLYPATAVPGGLQITDISPLSKTVSGISDGGAAPLPTK